jgi:hypothetical protein
MKPRCSPDQLIVFTDLTIRQNCCHLPCRPTPTTPLPVTLRNVGVHSAAACINRNVETGQLILEPSYSKYNL